MGNGKKWDIDWKKIGAPKVKKVTEPSRGVGTGVGTVIMDRPLTVPDGGVKIASVTKPSRPVVPEVGGLTSAVSFLQKQGPDVENEINEIKSEVNKMDMSTIAKSSSAGTGKYSDTAVPVRENLPKAPRPFANDTTGRKSVARKRGRDMAGGMGMLDLDFLLSVVEETAGDDKNDVAMRKMCFNEVLRTEHRGQVDSVALKVYAMDVEGLYGKTIQCQAMQELTERT